LIGTLTSRRRTWLGDRSEDLSVARSDSALDIVAAVYSRALIERLASGRRSFGKRSQEIGQGQADRLNPALLVEHMPLTAAILR
jgi:hypothetical protein